MHVTTVMGCRRALVQRFVRGAAVTLMLALLVSPRGALAADPAVQFMEKVGRELLAAARSHSPTALADVIRRHGDIGYIGTYSLGSFRAQLAATDRPTYHAGMVRFMARYASGEAPKYPIAKVEWAPQSFQGGAGLMVDGKVTLADGTAYDVRWLLGRYGSTYKVRDAMVYGLWMTPFLKKLFEDYIAQNGGNVKALVAVLNR